MSFALFCQIFGSLKVTDTCEKSVSVSGPPTSYRVCATLGEADGDVGEHVLGVFLQRTRGTESLREPSFFCFFFFFFFAIFFLFSSGVTEVALTTARSDSFHCGRARCDVTCHSVRLRSGCVSASTAAEPPLHTAVNSHFNPFRCWRGLCSAKLALTAQ